MGNDYVVMYYIGDSTVVIKIQNADDLTVSGEITREKEQCVLFGSQFEKFQKDYHLGRFVTLRL